MDKDFWLQACNSSVSVPPWELQQTHRSLGGLSIILFASAALASAICFLLQRRLLLWRRRGREWEVVGDRTWKHLAAYSGWMCAGCAAGAVAAALHMQRELLYRFVDAPGAPRVLFYERRTTYNQLTAAWHIFYPAQLLCVVYAMNLLLRRVSDHASHSYYNEARDHDSSGGRRFDWRDCVGQYKLYYLVRSHHACATLLCALTVAARAVAAAFSAETARLYAQAATSCGGDGGETVTSRSFYDAEVVPSFQNIDKAVAVSRALEAAVFVLMAGAFLLFFPACIVMFRRVERRLDGIVQEMNLRSDVGTVFLPCEFSPAAADGARAQVEMDVVEARAFLGRLKSAAAAQRIRFLLCMLLLLAALAALASLALFVAFFSANANFEVCGFTCDPCQSVPTLIFLWYRASPQLYLLTNSLCPTLPLALSLWLMTTKEDRALLLHPGRFRAEAAALHPAADGDTEARLKEERVRMGIELR